MEAIVLLGGVIYVVIVGFWVMSKVDFFLQRNIEMNPQEPEREETDQDGL